MARLDAVIDARFDTSNNNKNKHTIHTPITKVAFSLLMCKHHSWTICKFPENVT